MTVIELPDEQAAALKAKAAAQGLTLEAWIQALAATEIKEQRSIAHLQSSNPQGWARQFRMWADSHDPKLPVLSDAAMSRATIYPDLT